MNSESQDFVQTRCPNLWSILNRKAQRDLPPGLKEFLSGNNAVIGQSRLENAEVRIGDLFKKLSKEKVAAHYRRDLSGVDTENKLAELLCEITLVAALSNLSSRIPMIRPKNNSGTSCDVKVNLAGVDVYGDSKRLEDRWPGGKRSIAKSPSGMKPQDNDRPRSMDIYSKLKDAHRQFPKHSVNIIFLFHPSVWNSDSYIRQALFGYGSFFKKGNEIQLRNDALFAIKEWSNISGCAYTQIDEDGSLSIKELWQNPKTVTSIPKDVFAELKKLK